jgi:hypothetical protein
VTKLADLLDLIHQHAPDARVDEHLDGNLVVVLNARLDDDRSTLKSILDDDADLDSALRDG